MRGHEFFVDGDITFPEGVEEPDGTYRTLFGPVVAHTGQIYANTDHNFKFAARRLLGVRKPEVPGYHEELFSNQRAFIAAHTSLLDAIRSAYAPSFADYEGAEKEAELHHDDPHPKRALRRQAYEEMCEDNTMAGERDLWVKSVLWKLKKNEWAKPGKKPRSIGDLGVSASLLGFRVTDCLKTAQERECIRINGGEIHFCKSPDPYELERHFNNLWDPPGRFYFVYFSDDSCFAIRRKDGVVDRFNIDISSCDASHSPALFETLINIVPPGQARTDIARLVAQCELPLRVVSRVNKAFKILLKPTRPMLYSGSTITTGINNLANILIAVSFSEVDYTGLLGPDGQSDQLVQAAARAGYIVTGCEPLEFFEDVQFLKNSPVLDLDGNWRPMVNFGVFLRASGTCDGDLPGSGDLRKRAESFQRGLLACTFPFVDGALIQRLKASCGVGDVVIPDSMRADFAFKTVLDSKYPVFIFDIDSFCRRYRLDASQYCDLFWDFAGLGFGGSYHGDCVSAILFKDYGLRSTDFNPVVYLASSVAPDLCGTIY